MVWKLLFCLDAPLFSFYFLVKVVSIAEKIKEVCESLDMVYQCITLRDGDDTKTEKEHLSFAAKEINRKVTFLLWLQSFYFSAIMFFL